MKNLKYVLFFGLGVSVVVGLFLFVNYKYSVSKDFTRSLGTSGSVNSRRLNVCDFHTQTNWNLHMKHTVNASSVFGGYAAPSLSQDFQGSTVILPASHIGHSLLSVKKSGKVQNSDGICFKENIPCMQSVAMGGQTTSYCVESVNFAHNSQGKLSQLIAQNTFNRPMQYSAPPSGGGLNPLDDPAMPLSGDLYLGLIGCVCMIVYKQRSCLKHG